MWCRKTLNLFGYDIQYICNWGKYTHRYDTCDYWAGRPIHRDMSVAPPWAKLTIIKTNRPTSH